MSLRNMSDQNIFSLHQPAYHLQTDEIEKLLDTNVERGLSKLEAKRRHDLVGDNALAGGHGVSVWKVLVRQAANALTLVLPLRMSVLIIGAHHGDGIIVWNEGLYRRRSYYCRHSPYISLCCCS